MIEIQERDRMVLNLCYEQRILPTDQVARYVFQGSSPRRVRQRLLALEEAGLIFRERHPRERTKYLIRLRPDGVGVAEEGRARKLPQPTKLDEETASHDGHVTAVRLRLQELWDMQWIPESLMKADQFPYVPDGVCVFPSGKQIVIEIENSPKGPERFHEIQERWRDEEILLVLYVATTPAMKRQVTGYLKGGPQDLPFGLVELEDLESGQPPIWTVMGEIDLLSRRTI